MSTLRTLQVGGDPHYTIAIGAGLLSQITVRKR